MKRLALATVTLALMTSAAGAATYNIDSTHSSVEFKIKHLIGKVTGHFDKFTGTFNYDSANLKAATVEATIDASSIDTANVKRDTHLRSRDFFDVAKYPTLAFKSDQITDVQGDKAKLHGMLTMHGVTKPVVLDLQVNGVVKDPWGHERAGASASTMISRDDFMIGPSSGPVSGMVGKDVEINIEIEAVKQ